ncbi:MAG: PepSY domain-containing protein [Methanoregula sp.]|jgi:hypothetical protein
MMIPKNLIITVVIVLVLAIVMLIGAVNFVPSLQTSKGYVHTLSCTEKMPAVIVYRCQGFFDQLANPLVYYKDYRWSLEDPETINRPIRFTDHQECRNISPRDVEYTPDVIIDGQNISFDVLVSNLMGKDLTEVPYTVETRIEPRTSSWDGVYPQHEALVAEEKCVLYNFSDREIREVRVHARLTVPPENQSVKELVVIIPGPEAKGVDGSVVRQDTIVEGNLMIFIQSPDTVIQDPTPVRTQRPLTDAPGAPAWVESDRQIVQAFLENPNATVVYERNESNTVVGDYHIYRTDDGEIYVNDQSRRIDRAGFYESVKPAKKVLISQDQAESIARSYAKKKYPGFSTRNMQLTESKLLDHGDGGKEYSFAWEEQVFGVSIGNFVRICVGSEKGEIITYLSRDRAAPAISAPKISQEQAVETAVKYFTGITALSRTEGLETTARSSVVPSLQNRVVWIVDLHIDLPGGDHRGGQVIVDAETGTVLDFNPCQ